MHAVHACNGCNWFYILVCNQPANQSQATSAVATCFAANQSQGTRLQFGNMFYILVCNQPQPTSVRQPDCSLATCFAGFGILTMGSLAATGSEDNGFNYMGNIALTHNVDHKQFILWLLWFNSFYCHALVLLQLRLANQSMTFVWILTGTNIRIYSCQENDTNKYPNIFVWTFLTRTNIRIYSY